MSKDKKQSLPVHPVAKPQQQKRPQSFQPPKTLRNTFSLGGRRFNGSSMRRGTRH